MVPKSYRPPCNYPGRPLSVSAVLIIEIKPFLSFNAAPSFEIRGVFSDVKKVERLVVTFGPGVLRGP